MKMKIEASEENILQIEKRIEKLCDDLQSNISKLEEEREGDFWRMSQHSIDAEKVKLICENILASLMVAFKDVKNFTFEDGKKEVKNG
jgi:hypothetical protein